MSVMFSALILIAGILRYSNLDIRLVCCLLLGNNLSVLRTFVVDVDYSTCVLFLRLLTKFERSPATPACLFCFDYVLYASTAPKFTFLYLSVSKHILKGPLSLGAKFCFL
jgi:hypothetical protein